VADSAKAKHGERLTNPALTQDSTCPCRLRVAECSSGPNRSRAPSAHNSQLSKAPDGHIVKKTTAEFIGTFALVFLGCGAAVIGGMGAGPTAIDVLGIAFAFGLAIVQWHMGSVRYQVATSIRPSVSVY
jgi:hypothetical protein